MRTNEEIRGRIMRSVYAVYIIRQVGQPIVRAVLFAVALLSALSFVSVPHVFTNAAQVDSMTGLTAFFISAFLKTEFFVQFAAVLASAIILWSISDMIKHLSAQKQAQTT